MKVDELFPRDLPAREWVSFDAAGFSVPVTGIIYRTGATPCCRAPVGGIGTGCLDIDARGVIGISTVFNSFVPREDPRFSPFAGLSVDGETHLLASEEIASSDAFAVCQDAREKAPRLVRRNPIEGVKSSREIHYWGHYPVVDMEFELDAPVSVGLRAWSPFIPGDAATSSTPGAVFEFHVRNESADARRVTLAFDFHGPNEREAGAETFRQEALAGDVSGTHVYTDVGVGYCLAVVGGWSVRSGGGLGADGNAWAEIGRSLPEATNVDPGASVAADIELGPREEAVVPVVLGWYAPEWLGERGNRYSPIYVARYRNAAEVTLRLAADAKTLLKRVLAWQEAIFKYPGG